MPLQTSSVSVRSNPSETRIGLPPLLRRFCLWTLTLTVVSWLVALIVWSTGRQEQGGMWSHYDDRFTDLTHYDPVFAHLHQAQFFTGLERFAYPAPAAVVYDVLLQFGHLRLASFFTFTLLLAIIPGIFFGRALIRRGLSKPAAALFISILIVTSWPLLFLMERANIECVVILLSFAGAATFWQRKPMPAAVFWGLAASLKIYPIVLLLLLCNRRQRSAALLGFGAFAASLLLAFWFVGPTIRLAAYGTLHGINGFVSSYAMKFRRDELRFDHSYLAFFKAPLSIRRFNLNPDVTPLSSTYLFLFGLTAIVVYFARVRRLPRINQFILISLGMVSLPPVSYDYTLFHLYPSFALLCFLAVAAWRRGTTSDALKKLFWCFTLLFASENFVYYSGFHLNGPIKAVTMFVATILLLKHPLPDPFNASAANNTLPGHSRSPEDAEQSGGARVVFSQGERPSLLPIETTASGNLL